MRPASIFCNIELSNSRGFDYADPRLLNVVENNLEIPSLGGKAPWEIMPEFEKIPFEEIGLLKKEFVSVTC